MQRFSWFDLISLLMFLLFMGGNFAAAFAAWLFFTLLLKPDSWHF